MKSLSLPSGPCILHGWSCERPLIFRCAALGCLLLAAMSAGLEFLHAQLPATEAEAVFETIRDRAKDLASKPHEPKSESKLPAFLKELTYDGYHQISFREERALWRDQPGRFRAQFFHPGFLYQDPVRVYVIEARRVREMKFSPDFYDYGNLELSKDVPDDLSFAGVRLLYPLHREAAYDEVAVFLGMSYFRMLGEDQVFGASLRGLAIDTADPKGEEFPRFTEFYLEKPGELAGHMRVFALLESRSLTGAYEFLIKPGERTTAEVRASLFMRKAVGKLGLAPLTSMFLFGENRMRYFADFRPEVHDSDGLLVETRDGRWLWRPLVNPEKVHRVSSFENARGFGLLQRDRDFDHYHDLIARNERRPSLWVKPNGDWGAGRVELVEIPTQEERNDNIVAYWRPDQPPKPGDEFQFSYAVSALLTDSDKPPPNLWRVQDTRVAPINDGYLRFVLEFRGGSRALAEKGGEMSVDIAAPKGKMGHSYPHRNEVTGGWRVVFDYLPEEGEPVELRATLQREGKPVSETWVYPVLKKE